MAILMETCRSCLASLAPAKVQEIAAVLEALALHYPVFRRTDGENRIVAAQWVEDLAEYPMDLIVEGARLWRNSPADRFPTAGQFKASIAPILDHRKTLARRAAKILELETA